MSRNTKTHNAESISLETEWKQATTEKPDRAKARGKHRSSVFRLAALTTILLFCLMLAFYARQQRLNAALLDTLVQENDPARVHALLESGADPNIHQMSRALPGPSGLLDWLRTFFHRRKDYAGNSRTGLMMAVASQKNEIASDLIAHGANVNVQTKNSVTALLLACPHSKPDATQMLLAHGADWRVRDRNGLTPLLLAASYGHPDTIRVLADKGADVHAPDRKGRTPLIAAVEAHRSDNVRMLLAHGATLQDAAGVVPSPLVWAAQNGSVELLALAWNANPLLRPTDPQGGAALLGAITSRVPDAVKFLLDKGVPVNPVGTQQSFPQMMAASGAVSPGTYPGYPGGVSTTTIITSTGTVTVSSTPGIASRVAKFKSLPNHASFVMSPLIIAAGAGEPAIVKMLLDRGANPNATDMQGVTPMMRVAQLSRPLFVPQRSLSSSSPASDPVPDNIRIAEMLRKHGAKIDATDNQGNFPFAYACEVENVEMLQWLIHQGANVNARFASGMTPLLRVSMMNPRPVMILLQAGADPNASDAHGTTPLMTTHSPEVAALLLTHGAKINARDKNGSTALIAAARGFNAPVAQLLIKQGANVNLKDRQGHTALSEARAHNDTSIMNALIQAGAK